MPKLEGLAKERYEKAHGSARPYVRYIDVGLTTHGGLSPQHQPGVEIGGMFELTASHLAKFRHRGEHDVESIYWSMVCTLLRARPVGYLGDEDFVVHPVLVATWSALKQHEIPDGLAASTCHVWDPRVMVLLHGMDYWRAIFPPQMRDVAELMCKITYHIASEYTYWEWEEGKYDEAHLHEALQRLIFQYLVDHPDDTKDVPLVPGSPRSDVLPGELAQACFSTQPTAEFIDPRAAQHRSIPARNSRTRTTSRASSTHKTEAHT